MGKQLIIIYNQLQIQDIFKVTIKHINQKIRNRCVLITPLPKLLDTYISGRIIYAMYIYRLYWVE
jgi:hypothetical protein